MLRMVVSSLKQMWAGVVDVHHVLIQCTDKVKREVSGMSRLLLN